MIWSWAWCCSAGSLVALSACGGKASSESSTSVPEPDRAQADDGTPSPSATDDEEERGDDEGAESPNTEDVAPDDDVNDDSLEPPTPDTRKGSVTDTSGAALSWQCSEQGCTLTADVANSCGGYEYDEAILGLAPNVPLICDNCEFVNAPHFLVLDMDAGDVCRPLKCQADADCDLYGESTNRCLRGVCHTAQADGEQYTAHEVWTLCVAAAPRGEYEMLPQLRQELLEACPEAFQCYADCGWQGACALQCPVSSGADSSGTEQTLCPLPDSCL